jgi:hypothetical protein
MNSRDRQRQILLFTVACKMAKEFLPEIQRRNMERATGWTWNYDKEYDQLSDIEKHQVRVINAYNKA